MTRFEHAIDINVPISTAYNQWTQFETFPTFMSSVKSVSQRTDTMLHWITEMGGRTKEWTAEITEQKPDGRVAWRATGGAKHAGVISFHYLNQNTTRVMLQMEYEPDGIMENIGAALGFVNRHITRDLEAFKAYIESRGFETGGWRGEVERFPETQSRPSRYTEEATTAATPPSTEPMQATERDERNVLGDNSFSTAENTRDATRRSGIENWSTSTTPTRIPTHEDLKNSDIAPGDEPAHSFGAVEDEPQNHWPETESNERVTEGDYKRG